MEDLSSLDFNELLRGIDGVIFESDDVLVDRHSTWTTPCVEATMSTSQAMQSQSEAPGREESASARFALVAGLGGLGTPEEQVDHVMDGQRILLHQWQQQIQQAQLQRWGGQKLQAPECQRVHAPVPRQQEPSAQSSSFQGRLLPNGQHLPRGARVGDYQQHFIPRVEDTLVAGNFQHMNLSQLGMWIGQDPPDDRGRGQRGESEGGSRLKRKSDAGSSKLESTGPILDAPSTDDAEDTAQSSGKKKARFTWTPDVHKRFVEAVHTLGINAAKPQAIAQLMCLSGGGTASTLEPTRQNIKSHLQKYRILVHKGQASGEEQATDAMGSEELKLAASECDLSSLIEPQLDSQNLQLDSRDSGQGVGQGGVNDHVGGEVSEQFQGQMLSPAT